MWQPKQNDFMNPDLNLVSGLLDEAMHCLEHGLVSHGKKHLRAAKAALNPTFFGIQIRETLEPMPPGVVGYLLSRDPHDPEFDPAKHLIVLKMAKQVQPPNAKAA